MPIVRASYRPIPERLYHYTCGNAAFSIISGGSDDKICFWLKNAKSKNDAAELKLGMALTEQLKQYMHEHNDRTSLINEVKIDPELIYVNSFTETKAISDYMLKEYGAFRLEFDFKNYRCKNDIHECSYFEDNDIDELAACYCATFDRYWPLFSGEQKDVGALMEYLIEDMSVIRSIPLLKHLGEWGKENEWRHVLHQQPMDDRIFTLKDGSLRMKFFYPANVLVGVTCFVNHTNKSQVLPYYYKIKNWIQRHNWKTEVRIIYEN